MLKRNDEQLIANYLKGDEKSLEILIKRYLKSVFSFVYRHISDSRGAEDITQEVFVRVWRNLKKFNKQKSFKTWIFSIARNASIDFLRKSRSAYGGKKSISFSNFDIEGGGNTLEDKLVDPAPLPSELFERTDISQILNSALEKLSPKYRMILFLRYNDHFTFREIAEALGEPLNTVKSRHRRSLTALKEILTRPKAQNRFKY